MSTWLHGGWIGADRPKSAGKCVTSTDGVGGEQMSWIHKEEREGTAVDVTIDFF